MLSRIQGAAMRDSAHVYLQVVPGEIVYDARGAGVHALPVSGHALVGLQRAEQVFSVDVVGLALVGLEAGGKQLEPQLVGRAVRDRDAPEAGIELVDLAAVVEYAELVCLVDDAE